MKTNTSIERHEARNKPLRFDCLNNIIYLRIKKISFALVERSNSISHNVLALRSWRYLELRRPALVALN